MLVRRGAPWEGRFTPREMRNNRGSLLGGLREESTLGCRRLKDAPVSVKRVFRDADPEPRSNTADGKIVSP